MIYYNSRSIRGIHNKIIAKGVHVIMLLQALGKPILLDGRPFMKDFQLNLDPFQRRFRMKSIFLNQTGIGPPQTSVDIVVYNYSNIKLDRFSSLEITIDGVEQERNIKFLATLSFNFIKRRWKLSGNWNGWPVERSFHSIMEIIPIVGELSMMK